MSSSKNCSPAGPAEPRPFEASTPGGQILEIYAADLRAARLTADELLGTPSTVRPKDEWS